MASFKDYVRQFNKHFLNRLLGQLTKAPFGPFGMIHHRGRKSGNAYQTPIMVFPEAGGFLIALTYGAQVDWYRNLRAAGKGQLDWHRHSFEIQQVESLEPAAALPRFPQPQKAALGLMGIKDFIHLETQPTPAEA